MYCVLHKLRDGLCGINDEHRLVSEFELPLEAQKISPPTDNNNEQHKHNTGHSKSHSHTQVESKEDLETGYM